MTPLPYSMSSVGLRPPPRAARGAARPAPASTSTATAPTASSTSARRSRCASACARTSRPRCAPDEGATRRPVGARRAAPEDGRPGRADRARRGVRDRVRERGPHPRGEPGQAPPAAVQRAAARRQELPVHRDQPRRGVPAGLLHPRAPPPRPALLRAVLERVQGARDAQPDPEDLPEPPLRGPRAGAPVRACRASTTTSAAAWRRASATSAEGGLPGADRPDHRVPVRPLPGAGAGARGADARPRRRPRSSSAPRRCATAWRRCAT